MNDKLIKRLKAYVADIAEEYGGECVDSVLQEAVSALEAMQNPVAWRYPDFAGVWRLSDDFNFAADYMDKGIAVQMLYALPAPPKVEQEE